MSATAFQRRRREIAKQAQEVDLINWTLPELKAKAKALGLTGYNKLKEVELIQLIEAAQVSEYNE